MLRLTFGSVCSGIEAASVAWHPLGWRAVWLAEIEAFPATVLAHHYPDVPNLGDMTKIAAMVRAGLVAAPDVLVGGTPCQAFSLAGLRKSMDDARGQLSLAFVDLANAIDAARAVRGEPAAVVVWENVPGVLSTKDNAFGCFLAGLAGEDDPLVPPGGKWADAGCVLGPQRTVAWRVTDAQYFGVAQRRRRVFVVASAREGFDPVEVLFELEGMQRHSAPSRSAGQDPAAGTAGGARIGSHWDGPDYPHPTLNQSNSCSGVGLSNQELFSQRGAYLVDALIEAVAFGGNNQSGPIEVATACRAHAGPHLDFESETFLVQPVVSTLDASYGRLQGCSGQDVNHGHSHLVPVRSVALRGREGGNTAELGDDLATCLRAATGGSDKPHVLAPVIAFKPGQSEAAGGIFITEEFAPTLQADNNGSTAVPAVLAPVAFSCKDHGADAGVDIAPTLRAMGYSDSHANGGGQIAVCFKASHFTRGKDGAPSELAPPLSADADRGDQDTLILAPTIFTGDGVVADPISANEAKTYTHEGSTFRLHNCIGEPTIAAFAENSRSEIRYEGADGQRVGALSTGGGKAGQGTPTVQVGMAVRRLTPRECERLQAFPDDYTLITYNKKPAKDGPRYKALGNSMCVNNMRWIGVRIALALADAHDDPPDLAIPYQAPNPLNAGFFSSTRV
jgi:DNA (cytosine-5)-methyltransferase 1